MSKENSKGKQGKYLKNFINFLILGLHTHLLFIYDQTSERYYLYDGKFTNPKQRI